MATAILTGASRGLGLALTRELAARGWRVVVDARDGDALRMAIAAAAPGRDALRSALAGPALGGAASDGAAPGGATPDGAAPGAAGPGAAAPGAAAPGAAAPRGAALGGAAPGAAAPRGGGEIVAVPGDVTDPDHRRALVEATRSRIDVLVN